MQQPPADSTLEASDLAHNAAGSFYYPASARNPEQFIEFWEHVDIEDSALHKFETLYMGRLNSLAQPQYEKRLRDYVDERMRRFDERRARYHASADYQRRLAAATEVERAGNEAALIESRNAAREDFVEDAREEVEGPSFRELPDGFELPYPEIGRSTIRPLARAGALYLYLPDATVWSEADRNRVLDHQVDLGLGNVMSVRDIETTYKLSGIAKYLSIN